LQVYFEYCAGGISSNCTSLANGSTGQVLSLPCRGGDQIWVFEQYSYYDPGPGGNPTQVTVEWGGANTDGSGIPADAHADSNLQPGTRGSHPASTSAANIIEVRAGGATGSVYFSLTWTDPNGSLRRTAVETANTMRWSCSG
jgi:hypothetical protein